MERTWLDALSSHAVFSSSSTSASSSIPHLQHGDVLPPSPGLSTVASFHGDESILQQNAHAASTSALESLKAKHQATCIVRKTELLVAVGQSIRLADLAHFKSRVEGAAASSTAAADDSYAASGLDYSAADYVGSSSLGSFKTLATPAIDFEILSLVPSPSSRYVAAVGASQVVVIQVPRRGWNSLVGRSIECSQDPVGPFYHTRSSERIAHVSFHPWGVDDSTLLVLTSDALLREYDILGDPEEPTQIVDFSQADGQSVPPVEPAPHRGVRYGLNTGNSARRREERSSSGTPSRRRSRSRSRTRSMSRTTPSKRSEDTKSGKRGMFGASDEEASKAAAFSVGQGDSDWSPFTLFCLMESGDLFCICPYLPKTARLPALLLDSLSALISAKINHLSSPGPAATLSLYEKRELEAEYAAQVKFVNALTEQRRPNPHLSDDESPVTDDEPGTVLVRYPPHLRSMPARQGPFLLQPAPCELDADEDVPTACDLHYILVHLDDDDDSDEGHSSPLGIIMMAYNNGKIDICVDVAKVEATWSRQESDAGLPTLLVFESIDLLGENRTPMSEGPVQLLSDPEYPDMLYAQHNLGVHTISLRPLIDIFARATRSPASTSLTALLQAAEACEVTWLLQEGLERSEDSFLRDAVIGVSTVNDVYLGYAVIVLHANMHVTGIELSLRSEREPRHEDGLRQQKALVAGIPLDSNDGPPSAYIAFAGARDFNLPELLTKNGSVRRLSTRYASPPPTSSRGTRASRDARPKMELTAESLRFVGGTIEGLDKSIRELISAANAVQERLGVQLEEIPRQVDKLVGLDDELNRKKLKLGQFLASRLENVRQKQNDISSRADHMLQKLMDASQPDLSIYEQRWIEELQRVEHTVGTASERKSLESRAQRLKEQLDVLRPRLEDLARMKEAQAQANVMSRERMGEAQRIRVETALADESKLVGEAQNRVEKLQKKIALASRSNALVGR